MRRVLLMMSLFLLMVPAMGCAMGREKILPTVRCVNLSNKEIDDINIIWGETTFDAGNLTAGQGAYYTFQLKDKKDFYDEIYVTWRNAVGQRFKKKLVLTPKEFPIEDTEKEGFSDYLRFEFTQGDVVYYTHRTPNAEERVKQAGKLRTKLRYYYHMQ